MRIVLLGRPGSGKGTQARRLAAERGLRHVSTGDLLRCAVGARVAAAVQRGELVEDAAVTELVVGAIRGAAGVVLDGFPRTVPQAAALVDVLGPVGIDVAIDIDVSPSHLLERVRRRRVCQGCSYVGTVDDRACASCSGVMVARPDDGADVLLRRLWDFERMTRPVADWLAARVPLVRVPGDGGPHEVAVRIDEALAELLAWRGEESPLVDAPCP